ncbi:MAG: hypothetical protein ACPGED_03655, partial [Flavobacteriales bacterium]
MPANLDYTFEWGVADGNLVDQFLAGQIGIDDLEELLPAYAADLNAQGFFFPTASDVCDGSVEPYYIQTVIGSDDLDCPVVARVIWEFFAEDACGNQSSGIEVVCDFLDTTAPEFTNLPDGITVACLEDVPAPIVGEATDSCADVVTVESFDSETGFPVTECTGETAVAAPGGGGSWAVFLPNLEADGLAETVAFDSDNMVFVQYNDSTAHLTGTVVNSENTDQAFEVSIWLDSRRDWATWSSLGRSFKDNLGFGAADNNYENWDYYEMVNGFSTLTGLGDYAGSTLYLTHLPASYYYGFQCGLGANDKNGNFGMSGWFEYSGFLNGQAVEGPGDVNIDKECTPINEQDCPHNDEFTYFYRAIDSCGNVEIDSYVVTVDDNIAPEFTAVPADVTVECDELPVEEGIVTAVDNCVGDVEITYLGEVQNGEGCEYTITRTWAAFDLCGNRTDSTQTITVEDTTPPVVTFVPENATYECDEVV